MKHNTCQIDFIKHCSLQNTVIPSCINVMIPTLCPFFPNYSLEEMCMSCCISVSCMCIFSAPLNWHHFELTFNFWNRKNSAIDRSGCRVVWNHWSSIFQGRLLDRGCHCKIVILFCVDVPHRCRKVATENYALTVSPLRMNSTLPLWWLLHCFDILSIVPCLFVCKN